MTATERAAFFDEAFLRRLEQLELASRRLTAGRMKGERRSVRRGQSVEFADYRNYAAGDDLRQLDWNVYARLERLFIKLFVEEEDVTVHVLAEAAREYAARLRGTGPLILLSDLMDPGYLDALRDLAGTRCQLSVLHVLAPEELDPEVPPDARLVDNETSQGIEVTGDDDLVERYRTRLGEWQEEIAQFVGRRGGAYVAGSSDLELTDLLFDVLRRRRVL